MRFTIFLVAAVGCAVETPPDDQELALEAESGEAEAEPDGAESSGEPAPAAEHPDRLALDDLAGEPCEDEGLVRYCADGWSSGTGVQACAASLDDDGPPVVWSTCGESIACAPGSIQSCGELGGEVSCVLLETGELGYEDCGFTPLAIDLGDDGFAFEPAAGRAFDIAANGACLDVDWPTGSTAWLAIDRDGDGAITDGAELFGSGTPMPDRRAPRDGFAALASLDDDGDGAITPRDASFARLVLWSDHDGDRRGTAGELIGLAQVGIASLPLAYDRRRECDTRGNCLVERASVTTTDGPRALVDLHLACQ